MRWFKALLLSAISLGGLLPAAQGVVRTDNFRHGDWQPLLFTADEAWDYDAASVRHEHGRVLLWLRVVYADAQSGNGGQPYRAVRAYMEFDCPTQRFGERESVLYADAQWRIVAQVITRPLPVLTRAAPDSVAAAMVGSVCGR